MRKISFLILCISIITTLNAQEQNSSNMGPFGYLLNNKNVTQTLRKETIELPDDAKLIKEIEISYENEKGEIDKKIVRIDKLILPQDSIVLTSENIFKAASFVYSPILEASLITTPKLVLDEIALEEDNITIVQAELTNATQIELIALNNGRGDVALVDGGLYIKTNDKILRTMNLTSLNKVVVDFNVQIPSFKTVTHPISDNDFISVTTGAHPDYYRLSILIKSGYKDFELQEVDGGYMITLKK